MPANEWNVRIVTTGTATAFEPRVPGGMPGGELLAQAGDVVTWGNATTETHQPWPLDANGNPVPAANPESATPGYMSDPIPANNSSTPQYVINSSLTVGSVINYYCRLHPTEPTERGSIKIF
jgi:hypothetical protein